MIGAIKRMLTRKKTARVQVVYRSAITGRFVTREYAEAHPDTTVAHRYKPKAACHAG